MKKVLLLIASALLVCSGANAQNKWTNVIVNGDLEGEQDPMASNFWSHDYRQGVEFAEGSGQSYGDGGQFNGFTEIIEDPLDPTNHCLRVIVRSTAEAEEAGNMIKDGDHMAGWDSQFFISTNEYLPEGKELRISFKYRADKKAQCGTQAHGAPGDYHHWQMIGNIDYTTEWKTFEWEGAISADHAYGDHQAEGFMSIAFNLSDYRDGYIVYFDDIKLEVRDHKEIDPSESTGMINLLRKGMDTSDKIENFTTFIGRDGADGRDVTARIVDDPIDGKPAMKVTGIAYNGSIDKPIYETDDQGNVVTDDNGNPIPEIDEITGLPAMDKVKVRYVYNEETQKNDTLNIEGNTADGTPKQIENYSTQFFVTVPHKFIPGEPFHFKFSARASKETEIETQVHALPGSYKHWTFTNRGNIPLSTEWTEYEFGGDDDPITIISEANGCRTIAFNCNVEKDEIVDVYFRFEDLSFDKSNIQNNERILGTSSVILPLAAGKDATSTGKIDISEAVKILGADDFAEFISEEPVRVKSIDPETEEDIYNEVQLSAGVYIDADGNFTEDDSVNSIYCEQNDEETKDGILGLNIINNGVELNGKTLATKIAIENNFFYYVYNVSFMDSEAYTAVPSISATPASTTIYNIAGQRVDGNYKGIVIKNGKKVFVK